MNIRSICVTKDTSGKVVVNVNDGSKWHEVIVDNGDVISHCVNLDVLLGGSNGSDEGKRS